MPNSEAPTDLRIDHHAPQSRVLGVGSATPQLSWKVPAADQGWSQQRYELKVARASGERVFAVEGDDQLFVAWPDAPLASRESAVVQVRVGGDQDWSSWSAPVEVEAGLLHPEDWQADFISPVSGATFTDPAPELFGTWHLETEPTAARLYVSAHGLYEIYLNGTRVGDEQLAPGWTSYHNRLRYRTHDVTSMLRAGDNEVRAVLGNGWWRGHLTWMMQQAVYGDRLALLAQLEVVENSAVRVHAADESFRSRPTGILGNDLYNGQTTDLRGGSGETVAVEKLGRVQRTLVAPDGPPVRIVDVLPAAAISTSPTGKLLIDFGQNLVGWVRLRVRNHPAGHTVTIKHAEVLENGELGTRPLRNAKCTDTYFLAGDEEESLEPSFTFHGFRYAQVEGLDTVAPQDVEAVVVSSDMQRAGWFESSNELLNRFHENVVWGMRGNFVDVPTDCPQRDERLGWTGDIQVFAPTAQFLFDSAGFLTSWLKDLAADQLPNGSVPFVVPDALRNDMAAAAWGDAAAVVPWTIYQRTGDKQVLRDQLASMQGWVEYAYSQTAPSGVWQGGFQFGDWLDPTAPPEEAFRAKADPDVVATANLARSASLLEQAAHAIGEDAVAQRAAQIHAHVLDGFRREYVTPSGRILSDAQTAYAMALEWNLLPAEARQHAADRLADLVRIAGFRIATGFVGTPLITDALANNGYLHTAYRLLLQTGCPSWLYSVSMGATTVWERWDSMLPDGTINPGQMTSFNHYALGAVADWLHRAVAGLAPAEPGYRGILIAPRPGGGLTSASARHDTPFGTAEASWEILGNTLTVRALVPVGATATVELPGQEPFEVGHGTHSWQTPLPALATGSLPSVRQLMDDPGAWAAFWSAAVGAGVGGMTHLSDEVSVASRMEPVLHLPPESVIDLLTLGGSDPGRESLEQALSLVLSKDYVSAQEGQGV